VHKPKAIKRLLPLMQQRDGKRLIVSGHLHEPSFRWEDGILFLNPGSATAPDEGDPQATVAIVTVRPEGLAVTFIPVPRAPATRPKARKTRGVRAAAKARGASAAKTSAAPATAVDRAPGAPEETADDAALREVLVAEVTAGAEL
jgi:hypothetical protein